IHNDATGYRLDERVRVDARTFDTELDLCRQAADDEEVAERLAAALELWRGEPYGGLDGSLFEAERQRLTRLRVEAIERRQGALIRLGRAADGLEQLERACAAHPLHEGLVGLLMHSLHAAGEQAGALSVYETTRRRLLDELGLEPSPRLRELHLAIVGGNLDDGQRSGGTPAAHRRAAAGLGVRWIIASSLAAGSSDSDRTGAGRSHSIASVLAERAEANARTGHWHEAGDDYLAAVDAALGAGDLVEAGELCLALARITWDPGLGETLSGHIAAVLGGLDHRALAAQLRICAAGGTYRSGAEAATAGDLRLLLDDLAVVDQECAPTARAWALMQVRDALAGSVPASATLALSEQIDGLGLADPLITGQNERAAFADLLRLDRRGAAGAAARRIVRGSRPDDPAVNQFGRLTVQNCWNLAAGRYPEVQAGLAASLEFGGRLSAATFDQVVLGQSYWMSRELQDNANLVAHLDGALTLAGQDDSTPLWGVAAALLAGDAGDHRRALSLLADAGRVHDLTALPIGSHRTGILAFIAEILAFGKSAGLDVDTGLATGAYDQLQADDNLGVLLGWPTVFAGSKQRYLAFAAFASGVPGLAVRDHAEAALRADRWSPPHRARSLDAVALAAPATEAEEARDEAARIRRALLARLRS
ncbi:MAG: AfsR/SARP family transcriptional regulator, partial [Acidimicrobiales bacterium]|nr:AfsR/SARP family transcriptional regulator [Acidimicrobiales bacterium]